LFSERFFTGGGPFHPPYKLQGRTRAAFFLVAPTSNTKET
jgi:hypothetical protein